MIILVIEEFKNSLNFISNFEETSNLEILKKLMKNTLTGFLDFLFKDKSIMENMRENF